MYNSIIVIDPSFICFSSQTFQGKMYQEKHVSNISDRVDKSAFRTFQSVDTGSVRF